MRYLGVVLLSCLLAAAAYFAAAFALVPAPIAAEYWVREMLVVKRSIARANAGKRKLIVAAGSAALFGIDTVRLGRELGVPALNFGLHAAMSLERILGEAGQAASDGDAIVLALEPALYCDRGPTAWQARNAIAWDREQWRAWSFAERIQAVAALGPDATFEMAAARRARAHPNAILGRRLAALDDEKVLARWTTAIEPSAFAYSAFHLDRLGNMRATEGSQLKGAVRSPSESITACPTSARILRTFVVRMRDKNVAVRLAHAPRVADAVAPMSQVDRGMRSTLQALSEIAPALDGQDDVLFPRDLFFDTYLHLNARGREMRTRRLAKAIRGDSALCAQLGCGPETARTPGGPG